METNTKTAEKRAAVEHLNFGAKTAKRVTWEAWEFTIASPYLVEVTNASYGVEKEDHSYLVGVEDRDGVLVPAECECPADMYNEEYDCKHKVAVATIGGPTLLDAAACFTLNHEPTGNTTTTTVTEKLKADGGTTVAGSGRESEPGACPNGDSKCVGPDGGDLPCFDCFGEWERE